MGRLRAGVVLTTPALQLASAVTLTLVMTGRAQQSPPGLVIWGSLLVVCGIVVCFWARELGAARVVVVACTTLLLAALTFTLSTFAVYRAEDVCQQRNPIDRLVTIDRRLDVLHDRVRCEYRSPGGRGAQTTISFATLFG
jgi:hypothetical protein